MSAWIKIIEDHEADFELKEILEMAKTPHGTIDNVMRVHSLRPNTMKGHLILYRSVLHDKKNTLPTWFQETISSYVSILNNCSYSLANHWKNAVHLINDEKFANNIFNALKNDKPEKVFSGSDLEIMKYTKKLTLYPGKLIQDDILKMKNLGVDDGQILEVNQIVCYFNYVNRSINGLGVTLDGDVVGYYKD